MTYRVVESFEQIGESWVEARNFSNGTVQEEVLLLIGQRVNHTCNNNHYTDNYYYCCNAVYIVDSLSLSLVGSTSTTGSKLY